VLYLITNAGLYGLGELPRCYGTERRAALSTLQEMAEHFLVGADKCGSCQCARRLIRNSRMPILTSPGLGVTLNEDYVARCPVVRLTV